MAFHSYQARGNDGHLAPFVPSRPPIPSAGRRPIDGTAQSVRAHNRRMGITVVNLVSRPGSGVSTLLEQTRLAMQGRCGVLVLDNGQPGSDGRGGAADQRPVAADHLSALLGDHDPKPGTMVFLDSRLPDAAVADSDLGETFKLVVCDVTADPDFPVNRPERFADAELMVMTKVDLLQAGSPRVIRLVENARRVKPGLRTMPISCETGHGMPDWLQWLDTARILGLEAAE